MIDLRFEERIFESYIMSFSIPLSDPLATELVEDSSVEYEGEQFIVTDIWDERAADGVALKKVEAEAKWMRLADRRKFGTFTFGLSSITEGLTLILEGTGWSIGEVFETVAERSMEETDATVLDILWKWANLYAAELKFDSRDKTVSILKPMGSDRGLAFRYESNLASIKRHRKPPAVTRLYPIGRNDLTITAITGGNAFLEDYSYYTDQGISLAVAQEEFRKDAIFASDTYIDDQALYDTAEVRIAAMSGNIVTYSGKVVDINALVGLRSAEYHCGDVVSVYDEPLDVDERARVIRTVKWPHHQDRDEVEISFTPVLTPQTGSSSSRSGSNKSWELFVSRNDATDRQVRLGSTILNRIKLNATEGAEWVVGYKLQGVGVGTGNLTISAYDDEEMVDLWEEQTIPIVDGERIDFEFTFGRKEVPIGAYKLVIRANSDTADVGIDIDVGSTSLWVLARGTTRQSPTLASSIRYDYTGTVQTFEVPDDVEEVQVEIHGGSGSGGGNSPGGKGFSLLCGLPVVAGNIYDVYVGNAGTQPTGGWPNGGRGVTANNQGKGGGGASYLVDQTLGNPVGVTTGCVVCAGAGGGGSDSFYATGAGGDAGFLVAGDGAGGGIGCPGGNAGSGATQTAPGNGGCSDEAGDTDGVGFGGDGGAYGAVARAEGGGGGGGYHGGGSGTIDAAAGGGGSSWHDPNAFDVEIVGADHSGAGFIIISWEVIDNGV